MIVHNILSQMKNRSLSIGKIEVSKSVYNETIEIV